MLWKIRTQWGVYIVPRWLVIHFWAIFVPSEISVHSGASHGPYPRISKRSQWPKRCLFNGFRDYLPRVAYDDPLGFHSIYLNPPSIYGTHCTISFLLLPFHLVIKRNRFVRCPFPQNLMIGIYRCRTLRELFSTFRAITAYSHCFIWNGHLGAVKDGAFYLSIP